MLDTLATKTAILGASSMGAIEATNHLPIEDIIKWCIQIGIGIASIYRILRDKRKLKKDAKSEL